MIVEGKPLKRNKMKSHLTQLIFTLVISTPYLLIQVNGSSRIVAQTKLGKIQGVSLKTVKGTHYLAFRGIRYAQAPKDALRLKEPVPIPPWSGMLNATKDGNVCPQINIGTNQAIGDEDCLLLNVYTKSVEELRPVVVFIHGGGFINGGALSSLYGPGFFMEQSIVVVTIQYRLGALGFLSTGDSSAKGNWGLLDQIEALRWINSNIASFGGDPAKVTLFGEGAGAASAVMLSLSPKSKGLFQRIIAIGGSPLNAQYFQTDPTESAKELASRVKCTYEDYDQLVGCVRQVNVEDLVHEVNNMMSFFTFPRWFAPVVDNVVLSISPKETLDRDGVKLPSLIGVARHEGGFYYPLIMNAFYNGKYDGNFFDQAMPRILPVLSEFNAKLLPLTKSLKKRYLNNVDLENEDEFRPQFVEMLTDMLFTRSSNDYGSKIKDRNVPVYAFVLDFIGSNSILDVIGEPNLNYIVHGDVLPYIFDGVLGDRVMSSDEEDFSKKVLVPLLSNFIKAGNPTPISTTFGLSWPKFNSTTRKYLSIGRKLSVLPNFRSNIVRYWNEEVDNIFSPRKLRNEL